MISKISTAVLDNRGILRVRIQSPRGAGGIVSLNIAKGFSLNFAKVSNSRKDVNEGLTIKCRE